MCLRKQKASSGCVEHCQTPANLMSHPPSLPTHRSSGNSIHTCIHTSLADEHFLKASQRGLKSYFLGIRGIFVTTNARNRPERRTCAKAAAHILTSEVRFQVINKSTLPTEYSSRKDQERQQLAQENLARQKMIKASRGAQFIRAGAV